MEHRKQKRKLALVLGEHNARCAKCKGGVAFLLYYF